MSRVKRLSAVLTALFVLICFTTQPFPAEAASMQYRRNIRVVVDGAEVCSIQALDDDYANNLYISLKGLAIALSGTSKAYSVVLDGNGIHMTTGRNVSGTPALWGKNALVSAVRMNLKRTTIFFDEAPRRYFSFVMDNGAKEQDAYLMPVQLGMLLDMKITVGKDELVIDTNTPFAVTEEDLNASGFAQDVNSLLIGDGTTGEIYYQVDMDEEVPIASTTKLMTYFVTMDAVAAGECSLDDSVTISVGAARLSHGSDGVISSSAGSEIPLSELMKGMLLPSSNECALAIAEHVAGSEEAFVERMNRKAKELELEHAVFYNCHGLPVFSGQLFAGKMQNHMTAEEMFCLCSRLLETYPEITEITEAKTLHMSGLNIDLHNSNSLLYNMEEVKGLKTGTTNKAGACLVTFLPVEKDGITHNLFCILYGAEGEAERMLLSEISARYGKQCLLEGFHDDTKEQEQRIPDDPEQVIQRIIRMNCK